MTHHRTIRIQLEDGHALPCIITVPEEGRGPGLVLLAARNADEPTSAAFACRLADEGWTVVRPEVSLETNVEGERNTLSGAALSRVGEWLAGLRRIPEIQGDLGLYAFGSNAELALSAAANDWIDCGVVSDVTPADWQKACAEPLPVPFALHLRVDQGSVAKADTVAANPTVTSPSVEVHYYQGENPEMPLPGMRSSAAKLAYQRSVALFRRCMGPRYDLSALWDQHCAFEFETRDVDATMSTMVAQPYVNHIPTMTGGVGQDELRRFYKYHFIPKTPADTRLIPISRTVGESSLVDELLFCFTHDIEIDWMLPGIPATGRYVEIPLVAVVRFRGGKLYNEHIYWDQASVLVQIGKLDPAGLPIAGAVTARKLMDETLSSNTLMVRWRDSEGLPR